MENLAIGDEAALTGYVHCINTNFIQLKVKDFVNNSFTDVWLPRNQIVKLNQIKPENEVNLIYDNYSTQKDIVVTASIFFARVKEKSTKATWLQDLNSREIKIINKVTNV